MTDGFSLNSVQRRVILGGLIAAAFFLIEAGVIEIVLGIDMECRRNVANLRLAPDPFEACMPEWQWMFMHSASRGVFWLLNESTSAILAGMGMGVIYSIIGAISATLFKSRAVIVYLGVHLFLVAGIAGLSYLGRFIA